MTTTDGAARRFDAVLFDFSGTLCDDGAVLTPAGVRAQAAARGVELDEARAGRLIETLLATVDSPEGLAAREGCDRSARQHHAVWTRLMTSAADGFQPGVAPETLAESAYACLTDPGSWPAYPDTVEVLTGLHGAGLRLGVVSNIGWDVRPTFDRIGVGKLIGSYALSCEQGAVKPEPELFERACAELGVPPGRTLFVGDDPVKDGAAARLGMAVYLLPTPRRPDRPRGLRAVLALTAADR
ncbi:HAD family hydrolase [Micromonospora sp. WMMD882]|uniref:HAD family hydrolase n=1 Tax=Micromonospora sp. WMMD882 TaxID=3015151 RepID=UPI00248C55E3|nr:HAD family hydrolase [Micromonospora sp. WMMD882]WBB80394.1 HAD family hydrolase [Micromonospora sp. WMMD882]